MSSRFKILILDFFVFFLALTLMLATRFPDSFAIQFYFHAKLFFVLFFIYALIFYSFELYEPVYFRFNKEFVGLSFSALTFSFFISLAYFYLARPFEATVLSPYSNFIIFFVFFIILFFIERKLIFQVIGEVQRVVFIGGQNQLSNEIKKYLDENKHLGFCFENSTELPRQPADFLVISKTDHEINLPIPLPFSTNFFSVEQFYVYLFKKIPFQFLDRNEILEMVIKKPSPFFLFTKRIIDLVIGFSLSLFFIGLYPLFALGIKLSDPGPVLIKQKRLGQFGFDLEIYKFRTMKNGNGSDQERIFSFGQLLRKTHLDELPQSFNILRGQMSLVGPRIELKNVVEEFAKKIPHYKLKLLAKPGLTGWAQLHGYSSTLSEYEQKFSYDLYYLANRNLIFDLIIILKTIKEVILKKGR